MVCKFADFVIDFKNPSLEVMAYLKDYLSTEKPQFEIQVTKDEIAHARTLTTVTNSIVQAELSAFCTKLLSLLPLHGAMFLHASLIEANDVGVAFTAISGTGKSTHTLLWQKLLGDKVQIINGDKPIVRFENNIPYGYGTPWCGKEHWGKNARTPIKHICFIERSEKNSCEKITAEKALKGIFSQLFIPKDPAAALKTLELLDKVLKSVDIWVIKCNTDISAAEVAYNTIFKGET